MKELISIIVAVYNGENYLNQCIESIVNQTYKELEIIIVDLCHRGIRNQRTYHQNTACRSMHSSRRDRKSVV